MSFGDSGATLRAFLTELRRRRVFHVAVAYLVVGGGAIQLVTATLPPLGATERTVTLLVGMIVVGFPIALLLGWFLDLRVELERAPARVRPAAVTAMALLGIVVVIFMLGAFRDWSAATAGRGSSPAATRTVAVLTLESLGVPADLEYLRWAVPVTVSDSLSRVPSIAVRPFARSRTVAATTDPRLVGEELSAALVVNGHLLLEGAQLSVVLEAFDVDSDRVVWQTRLRVARTDLTGLDRQVQQGIEAGLLPTLGITAPAAAIGGAPSHPEAYEQYLRAVALPRDEFEAAIDLLERSVASSPEYAPAWAALGNNLKTRASFAVGHSDDYAAAVEAYQRALALDPALVDAAAGLANFWTESGELKAAHDLVVQLVQRRPDSAAAHHALSYVLRYGGLYRDAARECDEVFRLDPGTPGCAWTYYMLGDLPRARQALRGPGLTGFALNVESFMLLREGRTTELLALAPRLTPDPAWPTRFVEACLRQRPAAEIDRLMDAFIADNARIWRDVENGFLDGSLMASCGRSERALRLLRQSVSGGYCAHDAMQSDPLWASVRETPEFRVLLADAKACRDRFAAHVGRSSAP